jgi:trans-2,3-dihydro-3-hydroxyanthranilate isomerase
MPGLPFSILDVFTTGQSMSGNQLLVVEDHADTLSTAAMQQIAKEIGFAESAFVRKPSGGCAAAVRIFTIDAEVPQAGHPIIGLSEVIGTSLAAEEFTMMTLKGPISVRRGARSTWFASQDPCEWLGMASASSVASLLNADSTSTLVDCGASHPIGSTCGLPYALVAMPSEEALETLSVSPTAPREAFQAQCHLANGLALYFYFRTGESAVRTRMFCHEGGQWVEDVATGSAAGPLAAHLAPFQGTFTQGSTRRAHIEVKSTSREGARVDIGGAVLLVASGTWTAIPDLH